MPELSDVVPGAEVLADWGNEVRDRSTMRYSTLASLEVSEPNPAQGSVRWTDDVGLVCYQAGEWVKVVLVSGATFEGQVALPNGSLAAPALVIDGDQGLYRIDGDAIGLVAGGLGLQVDAAGFVSHVPGLATGSFRLKIDGPGTVDSCAFGFVNDSNTGMTRIGTDLVALVANGSARLEVGVSSITHRGQEQKFPDITETGNAGNTYHSPTSFRLFRSTSSLKHKTWQALDLARAQAIVKALSPISFYSTLEGDDPDKEHLGFGMEHVLEADEGLMSEGLSMYETPGIMAALVATVQDLTARLEALEA